MKSVSIVMPAHNRGHLLARTLQSIREQMYPSLEIIVVEDGDDGLTQTVAEKYDAVYLRSTRKEQVGFQSPAVVRNLGIRAAVGDILITQDAETYHEGNVIQSLVDALGDNHKILAAARTKLLPAETWLSGFVGACPSAVYRDTALSIGGYEEQFFGYGCEDDWYIQLLLWNDVKTQRVETVAAHQWHTPTPFEPFTGNANRALVWALVTETLWGARPPVANIGPIPRQIPEQYLLSLAGNESSDTLFEKRNRASAAQGENPSAHPQAYIEQQMAEVAWGLSWAAKCESHPTCRERYLTLADVAYRAAQRVLSGSRIPSL